MNLEYSKPFTFRRRLFLSCHKYDHQPAVFVMTEQSFTENK